MILIGEDTFGRAVEIIILACIQRPEKRHQSHQAKEKRRRYQVDETSLLRHPRRIAFNSTTIDDADMAAAAISELTSPTTSSGTVNKL